MEQETHPPSLSRVSSPQILLNINCFLLHTWPIGQLSIHLAPHSISAINYIPWLSPKISAATKQGVTTAGQILLNLCSQSKNKYLAVLIRASEILAVFKSGKEGRLLITLVYWCHFAKHVPPSRTYNGHMLCHDFSRNHNLCPCLPGTFDPNCLGWGNKLMVCCCSFLQQWILKR